MARKFNTHDRVSYVGSKTGRVIEAVVDGYATNGMVSLLVGEEERMVSLPESRLTLVAKAQPKPVEKKAAKQVYRWICLGCGRKYNGPHCPTCDSDERILNTDEKDLDLSCLAGGGSAEPYSPGE